MLKQVPNLFTLSNLIFGCLAIVFALQNGIVLKSVPEESTLNIIASKIWMQPLVSADGQQLVYLSENILFASIFIMVAAVIDFLDGFVARLFNASSEMGKQLDSLADVVSFGVAPSVIMYQLLRFSFMKEVDGLETSIFWLLPAFLIAGAGAYRLARFNIDNSQTYGFKGVPIPAAGLLIASFPLMLNEGNSYINIYEIFGNKWVLYSIILVVSFLMVSKLPLMAMKFINFSLKNNLPKFILILFSLAAVVFLHWMSVPVIFISYIILSLAFKSK